jgi:uncharacterized membrane protein YvbJ
MTSGKQECPRYTGNSPRCSSCNTEIRQARLNQWKKFVVGCANVVFPTLIFVGVLCFAYLFWSDDRSSTIIVGAACIALGLIPILFMWLSGFTSIHCPKCGAVYRGSKPTCDRCGTDLTGYG